jgi:hypothetical protein
MTQWEKESPPFVHGQESGFGTLEQVPQDPSDPAGYQQVEKDTVERLPRRRRWFDRIPLPLLLLAGVAVPVIAVLGARRLRHRARVRR